MTKKQCTKCGQTKPESEFSIKDNKDNRLRRTTRCKKCVNIYQREHYQRNKKAYINKTNKWKGSIKEKLNKIKDVPCADCKKRFPPYAMDFDHLKDKEFSLAKATRLGIRWDRIVKEIEKCEIVCACCHRIRTHQRAGEP